MTERKTHIPVLATQAVEGLNIKPDGVYIDATFGEGGHSGLILNRLSDKGRLIAFDQDERAKQYAFDAENFILIHSNFVFIPNFLEYLGIERVDGILADLGVSSAHLDMPERGFSYRFDAPLDMRMNPNQSFTAADVINNYDIDELTRIFGQYAQLRNARQIAGAIVKARAVKPIKTTFELVGVVKKFFPPKYENKNLSRLFQAIRIEVNDELENLKKLLKIGEQFIKPGGRVVIISFHSLEDRLVKNYFKTGTFDGNPDKDIYGNFTVPFRQIHKKVITADPAEVGRNVRSRSAKMRIAEKL